MPIASAWHVDGDGFVRRPPVAARRPPDDALRLGQSALLPTAAAADRPLFRRRTRRAGRRALPLAAASRGSTRRSSSLHGLNGSSDAHYMRGIAAKAFARGMNVVRLNQRNCGDTEHLSAGLFHSGLTADARHVVDELIAVDGLPAIAVAGYSLGGNLALKLAGEYGDASAAGAAGGRAVSPIIEISECVRALERPGNVLYQWNFVRDLKRRMRRKDRFWPGRVRSRRSSSGIRTVREFDEAYTAPYFGFQNAEDYYHRASAMRVVDRIRVPGARHHRRGRSVRARRQPFRDPKVAGNPHITCSHLRARRALRIRRPRSGERRRLLGGEPDRRVRRAAGARDGDRPRTLRP